MWRSKKQPCVLHLRQSLSMTGKFKLVQHEWWSSAGPSKRQPHWLTVIGWEARQSQTQAHRQAPLVQSGTAEVLSCPELGSSPLQLGQMEHCPVHPIVVLKYESKMTGVSRKWITELQGSETGKFSSLDHCLFSNTDSKSTSSVLREPAADETPNTQWSQFMPLDTMKPQGFQWKN